MPEEKFEFTACRWTHGHRRADARRIRDLIESFQSGT